MELKHALRELAAIRKKLQDSNSPTVTPENAELMAHHDRLQRHAATLNELNLACCFMLDFLGQSEGEITEADVDDIHGAVHRIGGSMMAQVFKWLQTQRPVTVTDHGGGAVGWHIGVWCSPGEAWILYRGAQEKFGKAISSGLLTLRLRPWTIGLADE